MRNIPKTSGIYAIQHKESGKLYVGSSVNMQSRLSRHRTNLRGDIHGNQHLQNTWNKYGEQGFKFYVLELVSDKQQLTIIEQQWIDNLGAIENGFNKRPVAATNLGVKLSKETREKIAASNKSRAKKSAALRGIKKSEETRKRMSLGQLARYI